MPERPHLVHVLTGLQLGGAEMMLYKVLTRLNRQHWSAEVIALTPGGAVRSMIDGLGIDVSDLGMASAIGDVPASLVALRRRLLRRRPALVQTWMYHADLIGGCAARLAGIRHVLWDIQGSLLAPETTAWTTKVALKACARLSWHVPSRIICCGHATKQAHVSLGYDGERIQVIPNAVDTTIFAPDAAAHVAVRQELGLGTDAFVVGVGARFDPQKDHHTMIAAWARLRQDVPQAQLLLFGKDMVPDNPSLSAWIREYGASGVHLLGLRADVPRLFAACDASCLSSAYGEGLPNVVAEAMACGVPSVVTDVGDSAWVVGETGYVAQPKDAAGLAAGLRAVAAMSDEERASVGRAARRRVEALFDIDLVAGQYYELYASLLAAGP